MRHAGRQLSFLFRTIFSGLKGKLTLTSHLRRIHEEIEYTYFMLSITYVGGTYRGFGAKPPKFLTECQLP